MWNGISQLLLWILRRLRLVPRTRLQSGTANPDQKSPEKEREIDEEEWIIWPCPTFRVNLNHLASQLTSIEVMSPTLTIEPVQVALYYTKEVDLNSDPPPMEPVIIKQEQSGSIIISAQPINRRKGVKTFNLCGISLVTTTVLPPTTPTDLQHPSYITLSSNLQHSSALLRHWTLALEQLSPMLKNLVQVVLMIDHTAIHGYQDLSQQQILMRVPKQDTPYQIPPTAILQALPPQVQDNLQEAQTLQATQSQKTYPQPPSPPQSWKRARCSTPVEHTSSSQTSTSSSFSSRTCSPESAESVILSPCFEKSNTPSQGILDLEDLEK